MTGILLLLVVAASLIGVLCLIRYSSRRASAARDAEAEVGGLTDGSMTASHNHISHSHVDCSAHSVDCGGHGGH